MSDTTDTPNDTDELAAAEAALEQAKAEVGDVEDKLLDGDPSVATADLIAAEHAVTEKVTILDRLRRIQVGRAERAAEKVRVARVAELVAVDTKLAGSTETEIASAWDRLVSAVADFTGSASDYNERLAQLWDMHQAVAPIDSQAVRVTDRREFVYPQAAEGLLHRRGESAPEPYLNDLHVSRVDVEALLDEARWAGAARAGVDVKQPGTVKQTRDVPSIGGGVLFPPTGVEQVSANGATSYTPTEAAALHRRAQIITTLPSKAKRLSKGGK